MTDQAPRPPAPTTTARHRASSRMLPWHIDAAAVLVILGLAGAAWALVVQPLLADAAATRELSVELTSRREMVARQRAARQDVESRLLQVNEAVSRQSVKLEPRSRLNQRLAAITDLAADAGIAVDRVAPGAGTDGTRHGTMSLRLSGKAPYKSCERFISKVHGTFNDIAVTTMRLMGAPDSPDPISIELDLLWFTAPDVKGE